MDPLKKRFGGLVAAHRRGHGWTQERLADEAGLSKDMIAKLETGASAPSFNTIEKLAAALRVDPAEFFTAELRHGALGRAPLTNLTAKIGGLTDGDLVWLSGVVDAALKSRG